MVCPGSLEQSPAGSDSCGGGANCSDLSEDVGNKELESHLSWDPDMEVYLTPGCKAWTPDDAVELQQRLCGVAHAGLSGHPGIEATTTALSESFNWSSLRRDAQHFVRDRLHCLIVGDRVVPRPYGPTLHATKPNEILHFDYLSLPESTTGEQYALVIKDDIRGADSWISDRGTHFKNHLIDLLRARYGTHHHFTTAYCPCGAGSLPASPPVLTSMHPRSSEVVDVTNVYENQREHVVAVQSALESR
ncbi:hypothetical protein PHYSODRAFT_293359 [Phytophthora sojae]|uniref:Integrase zinc-binding domain-containing protein n=1 Tax=Phytophthora sojae (strain P6497) TaxID=1094619 RepID=G4YI97_PHYSP|nr:hypothetical protein PHYSODRAFT_293359 [Phytophthora sojae]EGZ27480.1 hypothetical protein PHYSODRAFT_293359 [Phytophthora sojae]|eukprot:XP_009514755.1 hypothetical protein PHYSODRAFT_293359 [Phytophthora sojae]